MDGNQRGLSARHLVLFFLAGVAVCGVFFALGFLVGYNQRPSSAGGVETERLVSSGAVPPTVNPSTGSDKPASDNPTNGSSAGAPGANQANGANQPDSAKPKRGGNPAPEVSETNLEQEEIGHPAGAPAPASEAEKKPAEGNVIQVVALRTRQDAAHMVDVLKTHGYSAFLVSPEEAKASDNLYRVEVGPFATRREAEKTRERLSGLGYKPFIRR